MSLNVGVNSYITVAEADELIADNFISTNEALVMWNSLQQSDKEALLIKSCRSIDQLRLNGKKLRTNQYLQFPRSKTSIVGVGYVLFTSQFYDSRLVDGCDADGGLMKAKIAQAINAAYGALLDKESVSQIRRNVSGLTSKKAGPIAESYGNNNTNTYNRDMMAGIYTKEVYAILLPWVSASRGGI